MRICTYARCSTKSQAEAGTSLVDQESRFLAWLEESGHIRVRAYADPGLSGGKNARSATVKGMLADLPELNVEAVVIDALDRWSRDHWDGLEVVNKLRHTGIKLFELEHDAEIPYDFAKDADRDHVTQLLQDAEAERRRIKARQLKRYAQQRAKGATCTNRPPFGVKVAEGQGKGRRQLVPDENAHIVQEVDARILRGESQQKVINWLKAFPGAWRSQRGLSLALEDEDGAYVRAGVRTPETQAALTELKGSKRQAFGSNRWPSQTNYREHPFSGKIACALCVEAGIAPERALMYGRYVLANPHPWTLVCPGKRGKAQIHKTYMVGVHFVVNLLAEKFEKLRDPAVADAVLRAWEREPVEDRSAQLRQSLEREIARLEGEEAAIDARVTAAFTMLARPALASEAERVIERAGADRAGVAAARAATNLRLSNLPAPRTRSLAGIDRGELQFAAENLFEPVQTADGQLGLSADFAESLAKWVRLIGPPQFRPGVERQADRRVAWSYIDAARPEAAPDYEYDERVEAHERRGRTTNPKHTVV
jgi:DNA invertase Pin-like site-specific DNA recombinase